MTHQLEAGKTQSQEIEIESEQRERKKNRFQNIISIGLHENENMAALYYYYKT